MTRAPESTSRSSNLGSSAKILQKKKNRGKKAQQDWRGQEGSTPATKVNAAKPNKANKKKNNDWNRNCLGGAARNLSQVKCYNCNKKSHYAKNCNELLKN